MSGDFRDWDPGPNSVTQLPKEMRRPFAEKQRKNEHRELVKSIAKWGLFWVVVGSVLLYAFVTVFGS